MGRCPVPSSSSAVTTDLCNDELRSGKLWAVKQNWNHAQHTARTNMEKRAGALLAIRCKILNTIIMNCALQWNQIASPPHIPVFTGVPSISNKNMIKKKSKWRTGPRWVFKVSCTWKEQGRGFKSFSGKEHNVICNIPQHAPDSAPHCLTH